MRIDVKDTIAVLNYAVRVGSLKWLPVIQSRDDIFPHVDNDMGFTVTAHFEIHSLAPFAAVPVSKSKMCQIVALLLHQDTGIWTVLC